MENNILEVVVVSKSFNVIFISFVILILLTLLFLSFKGRYYCFDVLLPNLNHPQTGVFKACFKRGEDHYFGTYLSRSLSDSEDDVMHLYSRNTDAIRNGVDRYASQFKKVLEKYSNLSLDYSFKTKGGGLVMFVKGTQSDNKEKLFPVFVEIEDGDLFNVSDLDFSFASDIASLYVYHSLPREGLSYLSEFLLRSFRGGSVRHQDEQVMVFMKEGVAPHGEEFFSRSDNNKLFNRFWRLDGNMSLSDIYPTAQAEKRFDRYMAMSNEELYEVVDPNGAKFVGYFQGAEIALYIYEIFSTKHLMYFLRGENGEWRIYQPLTTGGSATGLLYTNDYEHIFRTK